MKILLITGLAPFLSVAKPSVGYVLDVDKAPGKKHEAGAEVFFLADPARHGNKSLFMSVLKIPAGGKVPEHRDPVEEYLYVLKGNGSLWIDDQKHQISPHSVVFMPAGAKVRFEAGDSEVEVLQVFAPSGPEKKYNSWSEKNAK